MRALRAPRSSWTALLVLPPLVVACSSPPASGDGPLASGGATSVNGSGGQTGSGGAGPGASSGGASSGGAGTGGSASTGGATGSGGLASAGGSASSGGASGSGGAGAGGTGGAVGTCTPPEPGTSGQNPLFDQIFTADPAVLVHDCTFYITAGRDQGTTGFQLEDWYVLSSTDLVNWSDGGGPKLTLDVFSWANANAWAGQMVERDGKFYWYVPINESGGAMTIGVAVADDPLGPFTDAIGEPLVDDTVEMDEFDYDDPGQTVYTIDPTVFVDDDGQAYLVYGGFWRMVTVPLAGDMISFAGPMVESTPQDFFEAPYLTKRGDTYYMFYAAGSNPATIDYATSTAPTGPWQRRGTILDELPALPGEDAPTSHPAVAEFAGQWYLAYHLSNGPGGGTYRRQVALEKLTFEEDGTVAAIEPTSGLLF